MSKTWIGLIIVAAVVLLGWTGFQFYSAITGEGDQEFSKTVTMVDSKLPEDVLQATYSNNEKVLVFLEQIEGDGQ